MIPIVSAGPACAKFSHVQCHDLKCCCRNCPQSGTWHQQIYENCTEVQHKAGSCAWRWEMGPVISTVTMLLFDITWITDFDIIFWLSHFTPFGPLWHRLCLRLPTTRSACHDCWRERQNHHLIRAVRATQSIFLGEMTKRRWLVNDFGFQLWDLDSIYIELLTYI